MTRPAASALPGRGFGAQRLRSPAALISRAALCTLAASLFAACSRPPKDPVERLLLALETAVEARDAEAFTARLTPDFRSQGGFDRAAVGAELRRLFALYEDVAVERAPAHVTRDGSDARIVVRVLFSAKPKLEGRFGLVAADSAPYRFELRCREAGGELQVSEAAWTEEAPGAVQPDVPMGDR